MTPVLDVREEVAQARMTGFHWRFGLLMTLIMFFDGYDLFNAAYVIPLVRKSWSPSPAMIGFMLSSGILGLSIGSVLQGLLADRLGRRRVMLLAVGLLTLGCAVLGTVVHDPVSFSVGRVLLGLALGMIAPLMITYLNEFAPRRFANAFAMWTFQIGLSAGGIFAGLAGITITATHGWQSLYWVGCGSLVLFVLAWRWLPESIQFLALHGRWDEVRALLVRMRPERAALYREARFADVTPEVRVAVRSVLAPALRRNTLVHWAVGFLSLFAVHGLTGWLPTIVVQQGQAVSSAFLYGTLVMVSALFGGFGMAWLADRCGSRVMAMVGGYAAAALSMWALSQASAPAWTVLLVAAGGFFIFGAQGVLNNFQALSYPTEVRGTGVGVAIGLNRVGGILGPTVIGVVAAAEGDITAVYAVIAGSLALAALLITLGRDRPATAGANAAPLAPLERRDAAPHAG